jgi:hypothetical protein
MVKIVFEVSNTLRQIEINGIPLVDLIGALSFLILLITLIASLKAASETARANILTSLPVLILDYSYSKKDDVQIHNIGNGTAVNIQLDSFYQWWADPQFGIFGLTKTIFDKVDILKHDKSQTVTYQSKGVQNPFGLSTFTMFQASSRPLVFALKFSDLSGKRFITKITIHKKNIKITSFPKSLNLKAYFLLGMMRLQEGSIYLFYGARVSIKRFSNRKKKL